MYLGVLEPQIVIKLDLKSLEKIIKSSETEFLRMFRLKKAQNFSSLTPSFELSRVRVLAVKHKLESTQKISKIQSFSEFYYFCVV